MLFEWHLPRSTSAHFTTFPFPSSIKLPPIAKLDFSTTPTTTHTRRPWKRTRSQGDVDGEGSGELQKKKRRLRLDLITSRLSRPYATPTTHIVGRGTSKFSARTRQRTLGQDLLRKAAILNGIRIKSTIAQRERDKGLARTGLVPRYDSKEIEAVNDRRHRQAPANEERSVKQHIPHSPSSLGLSNYDELDLDNGMYDEQDWEDLESDSAGNGPVYSDFNKRESVVSAIDDYDSPMLLFEETAPAAAPRVPSSAEILDAVTKQDWKTEVSLAQFGASIG
ncbi:hypothetical protein MMC13_003543 [Lambiella insularis]|nr:hypothetical protein [Lambiella insularis]